MRKFTKIHKWYCVATWSLWIVSLCISSIYTNFVEYNQRIPYFASILNAISLVISLVPVHPILSILSIIASVQEKMIKYLIFSIVSIVITCYLSYRLLVNMIWFMGV